MSVTCLTLITFLSFASIASCTVLARQESGGPVWKSRGGSITIHCSTSMPNQMSVSLQRRVHIETQVFYLHSSGKNITEDHRLKAQGTIPELDVTITNLTDEDTGAYWCVYTSMKSLTLVKEEGSGSLLLIVKGGEVKCEDTDQSSLLMPIISVSLFLLCFIPVFIFSLIYIISKVKTWRASMRPNPPRNNEVYEPMRATLRR